jgi:hypothetical protein
MVPGMAADKVQAQAINNRIKFINELELRILNLTKTIFKRKK